LKPIEVVKAFFESDGGKTLTNKELLEFKKGGGDLGALAKMAALEMGLEPAAKV
jgi:hypothetical protein